MKQFTFPLTLIAITVLSGCAIKPPETVIPPNKSPEIVVDYQSYHIAKNTQVQLIASDLAIELGVEGVEWNNHLNPWSYKTLRSRTIPINTLDKQQAYLSLFADTGLLPHYDSVKNRIFVEPYQTQIKKTYNFEPAFYQAAKGAKSLQSKSEQRKIKAGENKEFVLYHNETLQDSLNGWAKEAGYNSIIWYIKDPKQIDIITKQNLANITVIERSPIYAINAVLENINNAKKAPKIHVRVDTTSGSLVFHGLDQNEPFKVFTVEATSTKKVLNQLAKVYGAQLKYTAPDYMIANEYKTVITNRISLTAKEILSSYPLSVQYVESTNTIKVNPQ